MASAQPTYRQPAAPAGTMNLDRLERISAARRVKPASRSQQRADDFAVSGNQHYQQPRHRRYSAERGGFRGVAPSGQHRRADSASVGPVTISHTAPPCRRSSARTTTSTSAAKSACLAVAAWGLARNTSRLPPGSECRYPAIRWRSLRRTRFRTTAWPTARFTMNPTFGGSSASGPTTRCPTSKGLPNRRPPRTAAAKSVLRRIRAAAGSMARHRHPDGAGRVRR
jgi:hypothetical protein